MELGGIQIVILVERGAIAPFNGDPQGPFIHLQRHIQHIAGLQTHGVSKASVEDGIVQSDLIGIQ